MTGIRSWKGATMGLGLPVMMAQVVIRAGTSGSRHRDLIPALICPLPRSRAQKGSRPQRALPSCRES